MTLAAFLQDLLTHGKLTVAGQVQEFLPEDLETSSQLLRAYWEEDKLEMPLEAPAFAPEAAIWSAQYLYRAIQLSMLRHLGDETVRQCLLPFEGKLTPEAVYSADHCLRYLPELLGLAKGLAPEDVLVQQLKQTALQWPFSSVGMELPGELVHTGILAHPSLRLAYADRIINKRDRSRAVDQEIKELVDQALGDFKDTLWPDYKLIHTH